MISIFDSSTTPSEVHLASHVLDWVIGGGVVCRIRNGSDACDNRVTGTGKIPLRVGGMRGKSPLDGLESGYSSGVTVEELIGETLIIEAIKMPQR